MATVVAFFVELCCSAAPHQAEEGDGNCHGLLCGAALQRSSTLGRRRRRQQQRYHRLLLLFFFLQHKEEEEEEGDGNVAITFFRFVACSAAKQVL